MKKLLTRVLLAKKLLRAGLILGLGAFLSHSALEARHHHAPYYSETDYYQDQLDQLIIERESEEAVPGLACGTERALAYASLCHNQKYKKNRSPYEGVTYNSPAPSIWGTPGGSNTLGPWVNVTGMSDSNSFGR